MLIKITKMCYHVLLKFWGGGTIWNQRTHLIDLECAVLLDFQNDHK